MTAWPFRSLLFVPGHKPDWVRKAPRAQPDAVILDLEDAVPPALKIEARDVVRESVTFLAGAGVGALVRINGLESDGLADALAVATPGLDAVILPKSRSAEQIRALADALSYAEGCAGMAHGTIGIVPLPETAEGLYRAHDLAAASVRVRGIHMALIDGSDPDAVFTGDTVMAAGFRPTAAGLEQIFLMSKLVLDSRAAGALHSFCGAIGTRLDDLDAVRRLATRAKSYGFAGIAVIHPSHVAVANEVFTPSAAEVSFAEGVLQAMDQAEAAGLGAVRYRGMMIDHANRATARQLLASVERRPGPRK